MNLDTIIDTLSWYKIWQLNGFNLIRAKPKLFNGTEKTSQKFLEPTSKPKVIYTENSVEFGKACEDLSCNHCASKKGLLLYCRIQVRMKNVGRSMEFYNYLRNMQDLWSDGKTLYERRFGEQFERTSNFVWLGISPKTCRDCISSARKSYQRYSSADIEELEKMDASEIHAGRLNAKEVLTAQNGDF